MCPSVARRRATIDANTICPPTALGPTAVQDDLNAADLLEGGLDLRQKERPFGRNHGVVRAGTQPSPGARWADPVGDHRISGIPVD